jgi:pimeloyl-ACP methyl ester carboxylesterase
MVALCPALLAAPALAATSWDMLRDFRPAPQQANPSGVWSYLQTQDSQNYRNYLLLPTFTAAALGGISGLEQWSGTDQYGDADYLPEVGVNETGSSQTYKTFAWPSHTLKVHPDSGNDVVVRWTSPISGTVSVKGSVDHIDDACGDGILWYIDKDGVALASGSVYQSTQDFGAGTGGSALASIPVSAGDAIDFGVNDNGDVNCDSTLMSGIVTQLTGSPPPSSTPPAPGPRPIIFIPGITGSYLRDANGKETWPVVQKLADCLHITYPSASCDGKLLGDDALAPDGSTIRGNPSVDVDAANGIERTLDGAVGGAIDSTHAVHDTKTVDSDVYDVTVQNFERSGYVEVEPTDVAGLARCAQTQKCFIPIGVDWRKSAAFNAGRVMALIDRVIAATGTDRVDIVAHSQGGLIANALVHRPDSIGKVDRIVTFGTPWFGAPKLLGVLLYREPCLAELALGGCGLDPGVAQSLVRNYPGAAELNPSRAYYAASVYSPLLHVVHGAPSSLSFDQAHRLEKTILAASPLRRDTSLVDAANSFHSSVDAWAPLDPQIQLVRMIGYDGGEPKNACTAAPCSISGSGSYDEGAGTITAIDVDSGDLYYGTGDGTVPLNSANVYDPGTGLDYRGGAHDLYFCGVSHQGLAQSEVVWQFAAAFLDGTVDYTHDDVKLGCPDSTDGTLQGVNLDGRSSAAGQASAQSLPAGALVELSGSGFAPTTQITLSLGGAQLGDGTITSDSNGRFAGLFAIARAAPHRSQNLVASGTGADGSPRQLSKIVSISAPKAFFATRASIAGTIVAKSSGRPLSNICARAYRLKRTHKRRHRTYVFARRATTGRAGMYRIGGLATGKYRVEFTGCHTRVRYKPTWYKGVSSLRRAAVLTLVPGGQRAQVDAAMVRAAKHKRPSR